MHFRRRAASPRFSVTIEADSLTELIEKVEGLRAELRDHVTVPRLAARLGLSIGLGADGRPALTVLSSGERDTV